MTSLITCAFLLAQLPSEAEILATLQAHDTAYQTAWTVEGERYSEAFRHMPAHFRSWKMTLNESEFALEEDVIEFIGDPSQNSDGPHRQWAIEVAAALYKTGDVSILRSEGVPNLTEDNPPRTAFTAVSTSDSAHSLDLKIQINLWALGRGFTQFLDEIVETNHHHGGIIHITASGRSANGQHGTWRLTIDPEAQWMVRNARFINENGHVGVVIQTFGAQWFGGRCLPEAAEYALIPSRQHPEMLRVTHSTAATDTALLTRVHNTIENDPNIPANLVDLRPDSTLASRLTTTAIPR